MNCNYAEKISMLIDGELSAEEHEKVRAHIETCEDCRKLEKDFLFFSRQIKEPVSAGFGKEFKPANSKTKNGGSVWKKGAFFPAPIFGLLIAVVIVFSLWFLMLRREKDVKTTVANAPAVSPKQAPNSSNELSLARFDKGGRAEIYIVSQREEKQEK